MGLLTRRETIGLGAAFGCMLLGGPAVARPEVDEIVATFTGGRTPDPAGFTLDVPVLADNANAVTVAARIDAEMTDEFYCEELVLITEANPRPLAATFRFSPRMGVADVAVRLRFVETQYVTALARMSDGQILGDRREVTITGGGCGW